MHRARISTRALRKRTLDNNASRPTTVPLRLLSTPTSTLTGPLTLSAVQGPSEPPLVSKTLPAFFREDVVRPYGARPALIARGEQPRAHGGPPPRADASPRHLEWNFGEFDAHVRALARGLVGLGVKKGDRVGVIMGNNRCVVSVRPGRSGFRGGGEGAIMALTLVSYGSRSAYACLQWACASIGAILVTLNPAYRIPELVRPS